jgi:tetratricopeptide (TPR) repeat protein
MNMWLLLDIVVIAGPLIVATYLSTRKIPKRTKIWIWIICGLICVGGIAQSIKKEAVQTRVARENRYIGQLLEEQKLRDLGRPQTYINGLGDNPLLKHFLNEGRRYEQQNKFYEAIERYQKILSNPYATAETTVAAHILIGICYYNLSNLQKAELHYQNALSLSRSVENAGERLQGRAIALGNIGMVYDVQGGSDKALKYYHDALAICRQIEYREGEADNLINIGGIYQVVPYSSIP